MGQWGSSFALTSTATPGPRRLAGVVLFALLAPFGWSSPARAQLGITASRTSLLYSMQANPDCSTLSKQADDALPFNVARLKVVGAPRGVRFRWSMKKSDKGLLAADLDLGTSGQTSAVSGMCADFGSACLLTEGKLDFYNEDHILWVAPTCDVLPKDKTSKQFGGGVSHVRVKALNGRRVVGRGTVNLEWGRNGSVTLYVTDMESPPRFQNGIGRQDPIPIFANPTFAWRVNPPNPRPPGTMDIMFSGGGSAVGARSCSDFDGCDEVDFPSAGKFVVTLTLFFEDGSALCDNILVRVATCSAKARLDVIPRPKLQLYDPAVSKQSMVDLTVRLTNISKPEGGLPACAFLLRGAGVLTCSSEIKVGSVTDTKTTTFDLQHCSETTDQPCLSEADCPGERCLTQPHCSKTLSRECGNDDDCSNTQPNPPCPQCNDNETCIRVLRIGTPDVFMRPGESVVLLNQPVTLRNELSNAAKLKDTWTATVHIPQVTATDKITHGCRT